MGAIFNKDKNCYCKNLDTDCRKFPCYKTDVHTSFVYCKNTCTTCDKQCGKKLCTKFPCYMG